MNLDKQLFRADEEDDKLPPTLDELDPDLQLEIVEDAEEELERKKIEEDEVSCIREALFKFL